jgi:hypothetical protein
VAWVALALDPFYLLAFVAAYPFLRRPRAVRALPLVEAAASTSDGPAAQQSFVPPLPGQAAPMVPAP